MDSKLFELGFDPAYLILVMFIALIIMAVFLISINMKFMRLKIKYNSFMRGQDGKTLEMSMVDRFSELDKLSRKCKKNNEDIREIKKKMLSNYQKLGIVKYDAFQEMGGNLSFALTMLDESDSGWIMNAMHSREGCYTYVKEIVNGKSYIELSDEEAESLERAIYQEVYGLDLEIK